MNTFRLRMRRSTAIFGLLTVSSICAVTIAPAVDASVAKTSAKASIYEWESSAGGFNTKTYFYDTGSEVIAFDTQFTPQAAEAAIAFLRTKTQRPITYAVITHPNPDKFNGAATFRAAGAKIVASKATADAIPAVHAYKKYFFVNIAKSFSDSTYPAEATIDQTFSGSFTLPVKGALIRLVELDSPGVSSTQTVALLKDQKSIVVGDLVHNDAHAWLEGGIVGNLPKPAIGGWIRDLQQITSMTSSNWKVLGGRGTTTTAKIAIPKQIRYLQTADAIVTSAVAELGDKREAVIKDPSSIASELTTRFAKSFPSYRLDYMITYGVYGLVAQKLGTQTS